MYVVEPEHFVKKTVYPENARLRKQRRSFRCGDNALVRSRRRKFFKRCFRSVIQNEIGARSVIFRPLFGKYVVTGFFKVEARPLVVFLYRERKYVFVFFFGISSRSVMRKKFIQTVNAYLHVVEQCSVEIP